MAKKKNSNERSQPTNIEEIIEKTCLTVIDKYKEKEKKSFRKDKFRKTRLLMENYKRFTKHYEKAIDNVKAVGDIIDVSDLDEEELYIQSIRRSKTRTLIMVAHIDWALEELKKSLIKKGQSEKFLVIEEVYLSDNPCSFEEIAQQLSCNERTVRRWKNDMIYDLSILIFGVEAIEDKLS